MMEAFNKDWYAGNEEKLLIQQRLQLDGDFCVRDSENFPNEYVMQVRLV